MVTLLDYPHNQGQRCQGYLNILFLNISEAGKFSRLSRQIFFEEHKKVSAMSFHPSNSKVCHNFIVFKITWEAKMPQPPASDSHGHNSQNILLQLRNVRM